MRFVPVVMMCFLLAACASGARTGAMVPELTEDTIISEDHALRGAIKLVEVTGGKETNPLWTSEVGDAEFQAALEQALQLHTLLAESGETYALSAELKEVKQPFIGLNYKVTSIVHYALKSVDTSEVVWEADVENEYTANFGDSLLGSKRLRLANEGSVRGNIHKFIQELIAWSGETEDVVASD